MSSNKFTLSFCVPVYNEEKVLLPSLSKIDKGLAKILGRANYEIVVVDNGSFDKTPTLLRKIRNKNIKKIFLDRKGHGLAIRAAIESAKFNNFVISAIDLPFGFGDLKQAMKIWDKSDIVIGSKAHPRSKIERTWRRQLSSFVYRLFLKIFFRLRVGDPQGSVFLRINKIKPFFKYCDSNSGFFYTQISIYGQLFGLKIVEVPVNLKDDKTRKSKYSILKDGKEMFAQMLKEHERFVKVKEKIHK